MTYTPFRVSQGGLRRLSIACAVGNAAAFTVNAAMVASKWQRRA